MQNQNADDSKLCVKGFVKAGPKLHTTMHSQAQRQIKSQCEKQNLKYT